MSEDRSGIQTLLDAAVDVQVGAADGARRNGDDGIARMSDFRFGNRATGDGERRGEGGGEHVVGWKEDLPGWRDRRRYHSFSIWRPNPAESALQVAWS